MAMAVPRERWLRAMGYTPWTLRAGGEASPAIPPATPTRTPDENAAPSRRGQAAARPTPGLLDALLQAAGAGNRDLAALGWRLREDGAPFAFEGAELMLNLDALRRTPAAKRTLWRTLRALRRQQHTRE